MSAVRSYLPWLRQGLAGSIPAPADGAAAPAQVSVPVRVWINDPPHTDPEAAVDVPVALYGPGDVSGLDPIQIVRAEPRHQTADAEPNYFAHVELDRPDLPWLFTPMPADAQQRLAPWIVLVVVPRAAAAVTGPSERSLPVLEVEVDQLPDLTQAWAWAHAQVLRPDPDAVSVADALRRAPERTVGRLICPRRLEHGVSYLACVVPAFAAGRKAGLGKEVTAKDLATLAAAWPDESGEPVRLPIYYSWEFTTGEGGEFESLARRLHFQEVDAAVGVRPVDVRSPDWGLPDLAPDDPGGIAGMAAALVPVGTSAREDPWPAGTRAAYAERLRAAITPTAAAGGEAAEVRPPIYGRLPAGTSGVPEDGAPPHWLRELNLDPRHRIAAGLGALVVRYQQEQLMGEAWAQLPPKLAVGLRSAVDLAGELRRSLEERHLAPLPDHRLAELISPLVAAGAAGGADVPIVLTPAFRRLARPHGPLARHIGDFPRLALADVAMATSTRRAGLERALADEGTPAPVQFAPRFDHRPMFEALRDFFGDLLFPGIRDVPDNSVVVLKTNPAFVEAFMVGLNTEMSRELLWRGYPADLRATYFSQFWQARQPDAAPELPAIADWQPARHLGEHFAGGAGATLVLLLRGDLLRRYPRTTVVAVEAVWSSDGTRRELGGRRLTPTFQVRWGADTTLLGFPPLTSAEAAGHGRDHSQHPGWFFVVAEPVDEPRFGLDVADAFEAPPEHWDDLSWGHVAADDDELSAIVHLPLTGPLDGVTRDDLTWGTDSAQMAAITQQRPFRLAVHASRWVAEPGTT